MAQVTTITFFRYTTLANKLWAFGMMQFGHNHLKRTKGLTFYKLLGTGKGNGFNPLPDWSTYALLQVWHSEGDANAFFSDSQLCKKYEARSTDQWTIYMKPIKAEGMWSGQNPFRLSEDLDEDNALLAIITRATIRKRLLVKFWRYVPTSEKPLKGNNGLIYTKGIGEIPLMQMATFSVWKSFDDLQNFAYKSKEHSKAITMTRQLNWYKEELFSRFQPYKSIGTWHGANPLAELERID